MFIIKVKKNIITQRIQMNHINCELQSLKDSDDSDLALKISNFLRVRWEIFKVIMLLEMSIGIAEVQSTKVGRLLESPL